MYQARANIVMKFHLVNHILLTQKLGRIMVLRGSYWNRNSTLDLLALFD